MDGIVNKNAHNKLDANRKNTKTTKINNYEGIPETIVDASSKSSYVRKNFIGKGGFARCYEVLDSKQAMFACKVVPKSLLVKPHQKDKMASEIEIHKSLRHNNIVDFVKCFDDNNNVYIILELCEKKSMMELQKRRKYLTDPECRFYFLQIIKGCEYIHNQQVIHRDLKLGNLFLDSNLTVKIGDFGLATKIGSLNEKKQTLCGTPNYIAPEILCKKGHSYEVDVWSTGCILYTLYVGFPPFETPSLSETYSKIKRNDYSIPGKVPKSAQKLIVKMLQKFPEDRPKMSEVLTDEYFTDGYLPTSLPLSSLTVSPRFDDYDVPAFKESFKPSLKPVAMPDNKGYVDIPTAIKAENIANRIKSGLVYTVPSFETYALIPIRWFPIVPVYHKVPNHEQMYGHAVHVQDGNVTSFEESPNNAVSEPVDCYLSDLLRKISLLVKLKPHEFQNIQEDEAEDPSCTPFYWVSKWVDYAEKYGLGYELSDRSVGLYFNDVTHILKLPGGENVGLYLDMLGNELKVKLDKPTPDLSKKITIFQNFYTYMDVNLVSTGADIKVARDIDVARVPYVKFWARNDDVVIFHLSCGILQANFFKDHTKLIMCPLMNALTYIDENKQFRTFPFASIEKYGIRSAVIDRVSYVLMVMSKIKSAIELGDQNNEVKKTMFA